MLFEKPKYNYAFVCALWAITVGFETWLKSMHPTEMLKQGPPPDIIQYLPTLVLLMIGVYMGLFFAIKTFNLLGPKLKRTRKNLYVYGIRSLVTLAMVFVDVVSLMAIEYSFYNGVFDLGNKIPIWQEFFINAGFPILGIFLTWNLRNQKIELEEPSKAAV